VVFEAKLAAEVQVLYCAAARELSGVATERVALAADVVTVAELLSLLGARHARLQPLLHRMRLAVNGEFAGAAQAISAGDEVAVLPPMAGGAGPAPVALCGLRSAPLSVDEVIAAVRGPHAGAISLFIGTVRDHADGKPVTRLDYEAHATLAERELRRVLDEIAAEQLGVRLAALHRTGELAVGDLAVIVAASAPHRSEAIAACSEAIERIKARVPIWKKEWGADGSAHWVNLE
jgi:molybdopterin synthase catalytic subunit/molybdopterin converting factor small subunit